MVCDTLNLLPPALATALNAVRAGLEILDGEGRRLYATDVGRALSAVDSPSVVLSQNG